MDRRKFLKLFGLGTVSAPFVVKTALGEKETPTEENPYEDIMDPSTEEGKKFLDHYEEGLKLEGLKDTFVEVGTAAKDTCQFVDEVKERFYSGKSKVLCGRCDGPMIPAMKILIEGPEIITKEGKQVFEEKRGYLYVCFACRYQTEVAI